MFYIDFQTSKVTKDLFKFMFPHIALYPVVGRDYDKWRNFERHKLPTSDAG